MYDEWRAKYFRLCDTTRAFHGNISITEKVEAGGDETAISYPFLLFHLDHYFFIPLVHYYGVFPA